MFDNYDPDDTEASAYDDRDDTDTQYPAIERTPMNTHIGFSDPDPAIDGADPVATFD